MNVNRREFLKGFAAAKRSLLVLAHHPAWQAIVRDNDGKRCTFVSTLLAGRKG